MKPTEEEILAQQLAEDRARRDRTIFDYTVDALEQNGITPLSIWPESNTNIYGVIRGNVDYDLLPVDDLNEYHKGGLFSEQQDIIIRNEGKKPLCEAIEMAPCLQEKCSLFNGRVSPPVCREYKMAFRR